MNKPLLVIGDKNLSSWSLRPWLAMKVAGVDFDEEVIFLNRPETTARIHKRSAAGKVPVLVHDGVTIWESLAICEYVADAWAPSLWPTDSKARALARSVSHEMHAGFQALRTQCSMNLQKDAPGTVLTDDTAKNVARILELWQACRMQATGGPFLFGAFSIADAMYAPVVTRFVTYGIEVDANARAYMDAVQALPAFQEWKRAALLEKA
jgi:glutathione S-transferase